MASALAELNILDFSRVLAGPFATTIAGRWLQCRADAQPDQVVEHTT